MSNRSLTYKKIFVDSVSIDYRSLTVSSSDFSIELNDNMECPEGTRLHITDISLACFVENN